MRKTVVEVSETGGRRSYICPECGGKRNSKLKQFEVYAETGEFPAPNVVVRHCSFCGTYHEVDMWLIERAWARGI